MSRKLMLGVAVVACGIAIVGFYWFGKQAGVQDRTIGRGQPGPVLVLFREGEWLVDNNRNGKWDGPDAGDRVMSLGQTKDTPLLGIWQKGLGPGIGVFRDGLWVLDANANGRWDGPPADRVQSLGGMPGDVPVVGDWNGDGSVEMGLFRNGTWMLDYNQNSKWDPDNGDRLAALGEKGDIPVVGDWNGSSSDKIGVFRNGLWVLDTNGNFKWDSPAGGDTIISIGGNLADVPVVGDWNGDGRKKIGIFRNGVWILDYNGSGKYDDADRTISIGQAGDTPLVGDWNGDGRTKVGIFRVGLWVLDADGNGRVDVSGGGDRIVRFGVSGDVPLVLSTPSPRNGEAAPKTSRYRKQDNTQTSQRRDG